MAGLKYIVRLTKSRHKKFYKKDNDLDLIFLNSLKEVIFFRTCICIVMLFKIKGLAFRQETLGGANRRLKGEELIFLPTTPLHSTCTPHLLSPVVLRPQDE